MVHISKSRMPLALAIIKCIIWGAILIRACVISHTIFITNTWLLVLLTVTIANFWFQVVLGVGAKQKIRAHLVIWMIWAACMLVVYLAAFPLLMLYTSAAHYYVSIFLAVVLPVPYLYCLLTLSLFTHCVFMYGVYLFAEELKSMSHLQAYRLPHHYQPDVYSITT